MKIICEFDTWEELEVFRVSGKKTRSKKDDVVEEVGPSTLEPVQVQAQPQTFAPTPPPPPAAQPASTGFPGANGPNPPPANPVVTAILARIDGAISSGQPAETILTWFRQQIGPEAKDATLDQIKQIFVPRMSKAQLDQLAPQLGIQT